MTARRCIHCSDELTKDDPPKSVATGEVSCGASPDSIFHEPERCPECDGYGDVEIYDASTDGIIGSRRCTLLGDPKWHSPLPWVSPPVATVSGHQPGCDGTCNFGYPDGCAPF